MRGNLHEKIFNVYNN